jgi:hypothetical protein
MKESHGEGVATRTGPESCAGTRKGGREALTGERAGRVLSRERETPGRRRCGRKRKATLDALPGQGAARSRAVVDPESMHGDTSRENRESLGLPVGDGAAGRVGKCKHTRRR